MRAIATFLHKLLKIRSLTNLIDFLLYICLQNFLKLIPLLSVLIILNNAGGIRKSKNGSLNILMSQAPMMSTYTETLGTRLLINKGFLSVLPM